MSCEFEKEPYFTMIEQPIEPVQGVLPESLASFVTEGQRIGKRVGCFDYVPSDAKVLWSHLQALPRGRFCEWGSGMGIGVGIAESLGFEACGLECDEGLVNASRELLLRYGYRSSVQQVDYLEECPRADVYFVYCWPGKAAETLERFAEIGKGARLLYCDGAERIRCYLG